MALTVVMRMQSVIILREATLVPVYLDTLEMELVVMVSMQGKCIKLWLNQPNHHHLL